MRMQRFYRAVRNPVEFDACRQSPERSCEVRKWYSLRYSTVTDLARLRGWSTSVPR